MTRRSLPDFDGEQLANKFVAPRNETEEKLSEIWKQLMHIERIGVYDNFFELGAHSLLATRAISLIRKEFSLNIPIKAIFEYNCIDDLGKYIELAKSNQEEKDLSEVYEL